MAGRSGSVLSRFGAMLSTTAVRLSALYLALFAICAVALVFYVTAISEGLLRDQTERAVRGEMRDISRIYQTRGIAGLVRIIDRRSRQPGANLYIIAAAQGQIVAGNVASLQPGVLDREGWTQLPFTYERYGERDADADRAHRALARVIFLPNGMRLLVGRDIGEPEQVRGLVRQALVMALAIMFVGALAIWFFVGRRALKRIDHMSAASRKILAGDLSQRLPEGGSGDEFDRLSRSLNTLLGRIERLNEGLRQVSDNIAHDLKTPLTRLRNRAEAALAERNNEEGYRRTLEEMIAESDQLIRTFNALLMISRVEAGSTIAEMAQVDLSALAADAAELYEPVAEEAGVALQLEIAPGIVISGNRELLAQALSNLLDNAIKYAGGPADASVIVRLSEARRAVRLSVADNGPGVPADRRDDVVKRFVRLDESRTKPGTGLGLSLIQAVAEMHDGHLELTDAFPGEPNRPGLAATIILPAGAKA
ncbi:sensor histidine kinase [Pseudohoeflea coraliihabitans]|uniref:histidine kinase n=1 Tax=Pseudohoeflea coraliihabitans TaxID=2860393 RepID=A0ABS6WRW2_9HYPH|nr:HAMP domain-containing sensor histidine kinase [Pseudohoeflea sp. DP4N28-3]MBW3098683.1 HAMP domain-containing histidine kinase [Pseudohoeflea sp. DP4N28-3]